MDFTHVWNECETFVIAKCGHRPPSHGVEHMRAVAETSVSICEQVGREGRFKCLVVIVAWLHDVCDHKYQEVANMVCLLCSPAFDSVTGQVILMDGGQVIPRGMIFAENS